RIAAVMRRKRNHRCRFAGDASHLPSIKPVEGFTGVLKQQSRLEGVPPSHYGLAEVPHRGGARLLRAVLQEFKEENAVAQPPQSMQPLQHVHAVTTPAETGRAGQIFDHDYRCHERASPLESSDLSSRLPRTLSAAKYSAAISTAA